MPSLFLAPCLSALQQRKRFLIKLAHVMKVPKNPSHFIKKKLLQVAAHYNGTQFFFPAIIT